MCQHASPGTKNLKSYPRDFLHCNFCVLSCESVRVKRQKKKDNRQTTKDERLKTKDKRRKTNILTTKIPFLPHNIHVKVPVILQLFDLGRRLVYD
jgi:hypothetical protein